MNKNLLAYYVRDRNSTMAALAELIGVNITTFYRKVNGISDFYRNEILMIALYLKLTPNEVNAIFFDSELA